MEREKKGRIKAKDRRTSLPNPRLIGLFTRNQQISAVTRINSILNSIRARFHPRDTTGKSARVRRVTHGNKLATVLTTVQADICDGKLWAKVEGKEGKRHEERGKRKPTKRERERERRRIQRIRGESRKK